ncbi:glycosyl transferase [Carbonactinospora thermoautotrophica]|uniref:Glycosyl transferase n=1 Tax=Carbonactinospora thermoautotrophica TaxID=1469144 RepID=A0A132NGA1_9ACTN|nr:glycosyl transferase [Carbonactinospora thermoautotrophica]KWX08986.1 glycosyl transferase [Carbonactinospora thermoautotrophica]
MGCSSSCAVKVAIVTESFLPRVNGVTNSVCRTAEHLAAHGHEAIIISPAPGPAEYAGFPVRLVPGIALPMYPQFVLGLPTPKVEEYLREFAPDVVHLASPIVLGASGVAAARRLRIPTVAIFQTDVAAFARRHGFRGADQVIWRWLRRIHAQADRTLVPSTATMEQLARYGVPRLALWRRGVDLERFHPRHRSESLRRRLAPGGEVIVGYVGRLAPDKRVHLLEHLVDIPGVRLVVAGDGPAEPKLRRLLPTVEFLGFQSGRALSETMASLDVFVHTGADETFCQAVQEALAAGVPVVAPASGGPLDLVRHGSNGFLYAPDSPRSLRLCVERLVRNPRLRAELAARTRPSVQARTWEAVCDELLGHYQDVIGVPPGRLAA